MYEFVWILTLSGRTRGDFQLSLPSHVCPVFDFNPLKQPRSLVAFSPPPSKAGLLGASDGRSHKHMHVRDMVWGKKTGKTKISPPLCKITKFYVVWLLGRPYRSNTVITKWIPGWERGKKPEKGDHFFSLIGSADKRVLVTKIKCDGKHRVVHSSPSSVRHPTRCGDLYPL